MGTRIFVNVDVALHRDGAWLLITRGAGEGHAPGTLSLVGGTLETSGPASDILEATARREVLEEVGLVVDGPLAYVESTFFVADDGDAVLNVVFRAEAGDGEPVIAAPDEVAAIGWFTLDEVESAPECPPWTRQSLRRAEASRSS
jgi:8-oxo-dGTP pyrophosphatase MutT (NUDIX family)